MNRNGYLGLIIIVLTWAVAVGAAYVAFSDLYGTPRAIAVGISMAVAMFVNDFVAFESMLPSVKRIWILSGTLRGIFGLAGAGAIFCLALRSGQGFDADIAWPMVGGFILGGTVGTILRETRAAARGRRTG